jgi:hypothetical protein
MEGWMEGMIHELKLTDIRPNPHGKWSEEELQRAVEIVRQFLAEYPGEDVSYEIRIRATVGTIRV